MHRNVGKNVFIELWNTCVIPVEMVVETVFKALFTRTTQNTFTQAILATTTSLYTALSGFSTPVFGGFYTQSTHPIDKTIRS